MSDGILSDLLGERVRIEQRKDGSAYWIDDHGSDTIEGVVRAIVHSPLALIIETDEHVISARSLMANKITRIGLEDRLPALAALKKASLREIHMHDEWRPIYPGACVEQCTQCSYQRRTAGIGYQYRVNTTAEWFS